MVPYLNKNLAILCHREDPLSWDMEEICFVKFYAEGHIAHTCFRWPAHGRNRKFWLTDCAIELEQEKQVK